MTHTPNPIYENKSGRTTLSLVFTILITGALFLIIPLTQLSSEVENPEDEKETNHYVITPPPEPPEPPEPPKPEKNTDEPPEMIETPQRLTIDMIDGLLNPRHGTGPAVYSVFDPKDFPSELPVFDPGELDVAPRPILTTAPVYPPELKRNRVEGSVDVIYVVTPNGNVTNIRIADATHREFAEAVRSCLRRWNFEPGKKDNQDVASRVRQSFGFNLK